MILIRTRVVCGIFVEYFIPRKYTIEKTSCQLYRMSESLSTTLKDFRIRFQIFNKECQNQKEHWLLNAFLISYIGSFPESLNPSETYFP